MSAFTNRMFQGGPKGVIKGWEKMPPKPNQSSVEKPQNSLQIRMVVEIRVLLQGLYLGTRRHAIA